MAIPAFRASFAAFGAQHLDAHTFTQRGEKVAHIADAQKGTPEYDAIIHAYAEGFKLVAAHAINALVNVDVYVNFLEKTVGAAHSFQDLPDYWKAAVRAAYKASDSDNKGYISEKEWAIGFKNATGSDAGAADAYTHVAGLGGKVTLRAVEEAAYRAASSEAEAKYFPFY